MADTTPRELGELLSQLDSFMADRKACLDRKRMAELRDAMDVMEIGFMPYGLTAETEGWRGVDQEACKREREGFEAIMANHAPGLPPDVVSDLYFKHGAWIPAQSRIVARRNEAARLIRWILGAPMSVLPFILIALADRGRAISDIEDVKREFNLPERQHGPGDFSTARKRFAVALDEALACHGERRHCVVSLGICCALWDPPLDRDLQKGETCLFPALRHNPKDPDTRSNWRQYLRRWRKAIKTGTL